MAHRLAVPVVLLLGCAASDRAPLAAPAPVPASTPSAVPVTAALGAPPTGWPSAVDGDARPVRAPSTTPVASRCVTPTPTRTGATQPDLVLEVTGPTHATATDLPAVSGKLRNVSRRRAHAIVLPGDGSEVGWRDPVISFTAFIDEGDGCWQVLPPAVVGRCGLFDPDWSDEIVALRPGTTRSIDPLWASPFFAWRPGKVRLFVHYAWTGGEATKSRGGGGISFDPRAMRREAPYELISNPIELEITG